MHTFLRICEQEYHEAKCLVYSSSNYSSQMAYVERAHFLRVAELLTLFRPSPPEAKWDESHNDENNRDQHHSYNQVRKIAGASHHGSSP